MSALSVLSTSLYFNVKFHVSFCFITFLCFNHYEIKSWISTSLPPMDWILNFWVCNVIIQSDYFSSQSVLLCTKPNTPKSNDNGRGDIKTKSFYDFTATEDHNDCQTSSSLLWKLPAPYNDSAGVCWLVSAGVHSGLSRSHSYSCWIKGFFGKETDCPNPAVVWQKQQNKRWRCLQADIVSC